MAYPLLQALGRYQDIVEVSTHLSKFRDQPLPEGPSESP